MRKFYIILFLFSLLTIQAYSQYNLENDIVKGYMHDFSYDTIPDYNVSYVMDYFNLPATYRKDAPKPVSLAWDAQPGSVGYEVQLSLDSNFNDPVLYEAGDTTGIDIYNLIPGNKYYYKVISVAANSQRTTFVTSDFTTEGTLRMILAEGTWNVRDAGGWISTLTGKPIAYGKIFRGAQLKAKGQDSIILTADGIEALRQVGIRAELDLRSNDQVPSHVSALAKEDGKGGYDVDFTVIPEAVNARMYHFANNDATIRELQWIINRLKENKPVYYHCQNGADRTGTLGFLIGALLGMTEGDLAKDYELTTFCEPIAAAYDPTEVGFARLRNYEGKKGSPLGSNEDNKEYMFAELANTMTTVTPTNGTYFDKIYNFFRTGVDGTKISASDLSWFIYEMTGYKILGGYNCDVDTIRLAQGGKQTIHFTVFPEGCTYSKVTYKSTCDMIATVSAEGEVTAAGGGEAYIIMSVDGIDKFIPVIVEINDSNIPSYTIENNAVSKYMTETIYSAGDYTTSAIDQYTSIEPSAGRNDYPQGFMIKWTACPGATGLNLYVDYNPDFGNSFINAPLSDTVTTYRFSDLDPNQVLYYKVTAKVNGVNNVKLFSSAFKVGGTAKMIRVPSIYNVRDLGGWTGMNGHNVRYGVLYRGSRLRYNLDEGSQGGKAMIVTNDAKILTGLGIKAELDLRSDSESSATKSALNGMLYKFKRVADADQCLGASIAHGDAYVVALKQIIDWLKLEKNGDPVVPAIYFSGSLGAERTGALAFLINGLLGVSEEDLAKDYELSSFSGDKLTTVVCKRNDGNYPAMVAGIKVLNGETLQHKIFKYFNEGINGTSIAKDDLVWFISYMLDCPEDEIADSYLTKVTVIPTVKIEKKIYNLLGQEVTNPGPGVYIMDGKKYIINE